MDKLELRPMLNSTVLYTGMLVKHNRSSTLYLVVRVSPRKYNLINLRNPNVYMLDKGFDRKDSNDWADKVLGSKWMDYSYNTYGSVYLDDLIRDAMKEESPKKEDKPEDSKPGVIIVGMFKTEEDFRKAFIDRVTGCIITWYSWSDLSLFKVDPTNCSIESDLIWGLRSDDNGKSWKQESYFIGRGLSDSGWRIVKDKEVITDTSSATEAEDFDEDPWRSIES